jgi:hypothetical protein
MCCLQDNNRLFIVLEYCAGGDLGHYIKRYRQVSEATARYFLQQLAEGLKELRRHNVIHVSTGWCPIFCCLLCSICSRVLPGVLVLPAATTTSANYLVQCLIPAFICMRLQTCTAVRLAQHQAGT